MPVATASRKSTTPKAASRPKSKAVTGTSSTVEAPAGMPTYDIHTGVDAVVVTSPSVARRGGRGSNLAARIDALQKQEPAFIYADEFESLTLRDIRLPGDINELHSEKRTANNVTRMEDVASGLYDSPLLSAKGEEFLFRRMNYLRYRAARKIRSLNPKRSGLKAVKEAERLLKESDEARELIIVSNVRLVASIAQKFKGSVVRNAELVGEGHVVLMAAVDKFDYSRGFRFSTYATHAVQRHFYRLFQKTQRREQLQTPVGGDMLAEMHADSTPDEADAGNHARTAAIAKDLLKDACDVLSEREQEILNSRFGLGDMQAPETLKVIASRIGLSKERVRQLQVRALEKLHCRAVELKLPMAFN